MLNFLKNHPFAVEAFFESSIVLTYAVPKEELLSMIPGTLALDTFDDKWAFIAIAMVQTKGLRPKGFPRLMGHDFFLVGYRIFVRYTNKAGKNLRGLYIIKSDTNKKKMELLGNLFTHYNYGYTDIKQSSTDRSRIISSSGSGFQVEIAAQQGEISLPTGSPFANWKEARRYAGPLPFTFTYNAKKKEMLIIEGVRQNWTPEPLKVISAGFSFVDQLQLKGIQLANAFMIQQVPYYWKKGRIE
jgi:hypothetical protein